MIEAQVWSLCDVSQNALKPWADAGFSVCSVDIEPATGPYSHIVSSVQEIESLVGAQFVMSWPPCTHLANSGARWWKGKGDEALQEALCNVENCRRLIGDAPGIVENPVGRLSTNWRQSDCIVHPWEFSGYVRGESYSKGTCLWLLNGAKAPVKAYSEEPIEYDRVHFGGKGRWGGKDRGKLASKTPHGLSMGIFLANRDLIVPR